MSIIKGKVLIRERESIPVFIHNVQNTNDDKIVPVVEFSCLKKPESIDEDDEIILNGYLFKIIGLWVYDDGERIYQAKCQTPIGYNSLENIYGQYEDLLTTWLPQGSSKTRQTVYNNTAAIYKIKQKDDIELNLINAGLPTIKDIQLLARVNIDDLPPEFFWTQDRDDEYNGYCINKSVLKCSVNNTTKANVCPYLTFSNDILGHPYILIDNYLLRVIYQNKALCLNSTGLSCYSTGIIPLEEASDKEFYEDSEIKQVIDKWFKKL